jgi:PIN domain nuclease of toxin-antitoxin system
MRFLIDTHVLVWYLDGNSKLPVKVREELNNPENTIVISIASIWELAIKLGLKKINIKNTLPEIEDYIAERDFTMLNISFRHLTALAELLQYHSDPFDRLLIAQAIAEDMTIISADKQFKDYPVNVLW